MSHSTNSNAASKYTLEHLLLVGVTVTFGLISAAALFYHILRDGAFDEPFLWIFSTLAGVFAFGMAIMPAALAKPHGEAIEGASAQGSLTLVVIMVMIVDGALEWHAVSIIAECINMQLPPWWAMLLIIASFQVSMFMGRGALAASTSEQRELLAAEAERMALIEARKQAEIAKANAHQDKLADRRAKYAAKKGNVVNLR